MAVEYNHRLIESSHFTESLCEYTSAAAPAVKSCLRQLGFVIQRLELGASQLYDLVIFGLGYDANGGRQQRRVSRITCRFTLTAGSE